MTREILAKINDNGMSVNKIITIAHEINDMKDVNARKWAIDSFINELMKYFNIDTVSYVDGTICNDYINWDSNCGCSIVRASIDLKAIADYLIENDLEPTFSNASDALCNLDERTEFWTDVIDDNIYEIKIDALIELMSMDSEDKGEAEFIADFNKYKRKMANLTEREQIYDKLSKVLTEYETYVHGEEDNDKIYERAADMYEVLVEIQRKWETDITNQN